jgi:hypothetical protein
MGMKLCPLTLREKHGLRMFESRVLRGIFELKRDDVTRGWRNLHNKENRNLHFSPSIIRLVSSSRIRCAGHVAHS